MTDGTRPFEGEVSELERLRGRVAELEGVESELRRSQDALSRLLRNEQLAADCLQDLVGTSGVGAAMQKVVERLQSAAGVSRAYVFENFEDPKKGLCMRQIHEAVAPGVEAHIDDPSLRALPYADVSARLLERLSSNEAHCGLVRQMPEPDRTILSSQGILSIVLQPIRVDGRLWGFIGCDDCETERLWSDEEIHVLRTVSSAIAAILGRSRAAAALAESEERYRALFREMLSGFLLVEVLHDETGGFRDLRILEANPAYEAIMGRSCKEAIGKTTRDLVPTEEADEILRIYGDVALSRIPIHIERYSPSLGKFLEVMAFSPRPGQVAMTFLDVTAQRRAESERQALAALATRLAATASVDAILDVLMETTDRLLGWDAMYFAVRPSGDEAFLVVLLMDTVQGRKQSLVPASPRWPVATLSGTIRSVAQEGRPVLINRTPDEPGPKLERFGDRAKTSASLMYVPVRSGSRIIGILSAQSYTPRRYSEASLDLLQRVADIVAPALERAFIEQALAREKERLAITLQSIGDGVVATNAEGAVEFMNRMAEDITGWSEADALGKPLADVLRLVDEKTRRPIENPVAMILRAGRPVALQDNTLLISRAGREIPLTDSGAPILGKDGRPLGAVLVFRDVTERRRLQEEVLNARKIESLAVLAGGVAHDFNNLLTGIVGNLSLARLYLDDGETEPLRDLLFEVENASMRAAGLTQQLLTFARGSTPIKEITSLVAFIREAVRFALRGTSVMDSFKVERDIWPVEIDTSQFQQVINNIVLNAVDAMPGGGTLYVEIANVEVAADRSIPLAPGRYVRIVFRDQGTGIAPAHLPRIFDPYFTTKEKGSGLGLATTFSIIQRHGGHITAESRLGEGAAFTIHLPVTQEEETPARPRTNAARRDSGRILVMDDEEMVRNVATGVLRHAGYEVDVAAHGKECLERYVEAARAGRPYDAVVMDLTIPGGMGGRETLKRLLDIDPDAAAIASSGYSTDMVLADCRAHGFKAVVPKPYVAESLAESVRRVLAARRAGNDRSL